MSDKNGIEEAAKRGIKLGEVGQKIVFENEHVSIWEINLDPGETIDFHIHYHPYVVISLGGGENEIETIFGQSHQDRGGTRLNGLHEPDARRSPSDEPCENSSICRASSN